MEDYVDKLVVCVKGTASTEFGGKYRVIKEARSKYLIMDDNGSYRWFAKTRFARVKV